MPPTAADPKFEHEVHDSKENLQFMTDLEINQPREGPGKSLGIDILHDSVLLCSAAGPGCPIPVNAVRSDCSVPLHSTDLWHCYETYSAMTKDLPRENV